MQKIVIKIKEEAVPPITSLPSLLSSRLLAIVEVDEEGNEKRNDKKENPIVAPLKPSEEQHGNEQKEEDKMTAKLEEKISIQTLVTLPVTTPPPSSQNLHVRSTWEAPLQISMQSNSTPKSVEATSFEDLSLDEVIVYQCLI